MTSSEAAKSQSLPTVYLNATLTGVLQWLLEWCEGTSNVVVCSSHDDFDEQLLDEIATSPENAELLQPTLARLSKSHQIQFVFCHSVPALHAHISASAFRPCVSGEGEARRMIFVNPLRLHEPTPSFSAQGLSRFFAAAVSAADCTCQEVSFVECETTGDDMAPLLAEDMESELPDDPVNADTVERDSELVGQGSSHKRDPWKTQVPILNATTKSFGPGERGWVGRTVEVGRIAATWCRFADFQSNSVERL